MRQGLDEKDMMILKILEKDSRKPWRQIANELNVSEATVYLRIKRLEENGIIKCFGIKVDPVKVGLMTTMFVLAKTKADNIVYVKNEIQKLNYVVELHEITGPYQFLIKILAPSQKDASRALEDLARIKGLIEINALMSLNIVKSGENVLDTLNYWIKKNG
ncbi:MAG: Lrp/AsnC family transcriptional regulator [Caldisphaeraceae archaeon]|nr:Lrp/AsnC family transcriptional regulator [Caldisphaeraceae archaeon]MEB2792599.1 Lrp/AsnC family transcriptional regulator [Caldisphaeraceae archaeon]MEB3692196.1 Lrp/AsnC family transcriptional regulator [Caldisphaeraceae archaeon]MEB3797979.1 Lrp/AsnC family transcriptional regulator [Caldisphaeraceae archaeon]